MHNHTWSSILLTAFFPNKNLMTFDCLKSFHTAGGVAQVVERLGFELRASHLLGRTAK
jgi:hypothetical protein